MSHSRVLCQEASDSAQLWRKECGIQLPLGVGTRASVHLRCVSAAGRGGRDRGCSCLLLPLRPCVRAPAVGGEAFIAPKVLEVPAGHRPGDLLGGVKQSVAHLMAVPGWEQALYPTCVPKDPPGARFPTLSWSPSSRIMTCTKLPATCCCASSASSATRADPNCPIVLLWVLLELMWWEAARQGGWTHNPSKSSSVMGLSLPSLCHALGPGMLL